MFLHTMALLVFAQPAIEPIVLSQDQDAAREACMAGPEYKANPTQKVTRGDESRKPVHRTQSPERRLAMMSQADDNSDGVLTREELCVALVGQFEKVDRNDDQQINKDDAPRGLFRSRFLARMEELSAALDRDGDDSISFAEFSMGPVDSFAVADTDADGSVGLDQLTETITAKNLDTQE